MDCKTRIKASYRYLSVRNKSSNCLHLLGKCARVFVGRRYFSSLLKSEELSESGQITEHIFASNGGLCVCSSLCIFYNTRSFEIWGISLGYLPVLSHVALRRIAREGKYLMNWEALLLTLLLARNVQNETLQCFVQVTTRESDRSLSCKN